MPPQQTRINQDELYIESSSRPVMEAIPKEILPIGSKTLANVVEFIGNTPLIRLNSIPASMGIKCEVLAKCEFFGPGGSHKDRIALQMIENAEKSGELRPGGTIIEPTSGNTGIAIAMIAAVKGYKCIFTMTDKNSQEKVEILRAMGAKVIMVPGLPRDHPGSYISTAVRLQQETPNSIMLNQYANPGNPEAHYENTGVEILNQCSGSVDMIVVGAGTGGAITGLGRRMKASCKKCIVVGVDPEGSTLAEPQAINQTGTKAWEVEGIGHNDFTPVNLDKSVVDKWYKSNDTDSLVMARRLIQEEGLLVGGSSGSVMSCALQAVQDANLSPGQKCVILFPDSIRNYMTKFLTKSWMLEKNLLNEAELENEQEHLWWSRKVSELSLESPVLTLTPSSTIEKAVMTMKFMNVAHIPVIEDNGTIRGIVTSEGIMTKLLTKKVTKDESVEKVLTVKYKKITEDTTLAKVSAILNTSGDYAVIVRRNGSSETIQGILTQTDLLGYMVQNF